MPRSSRSAIVVQRPADEAAAQPEEQSANSGRVGALVSFLCYGVLFGTWASIVPAVQQRDGLDDAQLGAAIFVSALAAVLTGAFLGARMVRRGSIHAVRGGACAFAAGMILALLVPEGWTLAAGGVLLGFGSSALSVGLNTQGVAVERRIGRPILIRLHGFWSAGGFLGGGLALAGGAAGVPMVVRTPLVAIVVTTVILAVSRRALDDPVTISPGRANTSIGRHTRGLLLVGVVGMCSVVVEFGIRDWIGVFMHDAVHLDVDTAAIGYSTFAFTMMTGRLLADSVWSRVAPAKVLPVLFTGTAVIGLVGLVAHTTASTLVAMTALGLGVSCAVPICMRVAGAIGLAHGNPGSAIARVNAMGWMGALAEAPTIGILAQSVGIGEALTILPVLLLVMAVAMLRARSVFSLGGTNTARPMGVRAGTRSHPSFRHIPRPDMAFS